VSDPTPPVPEFQEYRKIPRLRRGCVITEKIDGSNGQICFPEPDAPMLVGSRNRWITPEADNYGFARWAYEHEAELRKLGPGRHFGEWFGAGIQRNYGMIEKRFALFDVLRWTAPDAVLPSCVSLVPLLYQGDFTDTAVAAALETLRTTGSKVLPFMNPEGIVVYHVASRTQFKVTLGDDGHKGT